MSLLSATTALGIPGLVLLLSPVWTQLLFLTNPSLAVCLSVDGLFPFCSTLVCSLLLVFLTCFRSVGFCCRAQVGSHSVPVSELPSWTVAAQMKDLLLSYLYLQALCRIHGKDHSCVTNC